VSSVPFKEAKGWGKNNNNINNLAAERKRRKVSPFIDKQFSK
jgi:hypothetical protein